MVVEKGAVGRDVGRRDGGGAESSLPLQSRSDANLSPIEMGMDHTVHPRPNTPPPHSLASLAHTLQKAIAQNTNLTTLLDQAREEHPLHTMTGLEGTAWDPNNKGTAD